MHHVTKHLVTEKKGEVVGAMAKVRVAISAASFEILEIEDIWHVWNVV